MATYGGEAFLWLPLGIFSLLPVASQHLTFIPNPTPSLGFNPSQYPLHLKEAL